MSGNETGGPAFTLGTAFKPGTVDDEAVAQMVTILDLQEAAPSIERLRAWALAAADVRPGDTCVDVGCGTGTMTRRLADLAGDGSAGRVLGVEPNAVLEQIAAQRAAAAGSPARFCRGLATALPLPDVAVDVVWCERVLQHVPDPSAAIAEIARVLRPGGRALLLDSDHESRVDSDMDPAVAHALTLAYMSQLANPRAARSIPRQALAAGLVVDPDVGSSALVFPQEQLATGRLHRMAADQAVADGLLDAAVADAAVQALADAARQGRAFSAVTVFGFVCRKP
jgi:ubiquinone/menaquinone biosynthesis C-methylase UbiE